MAILGTRKRILATGGASQNKVILQVRKEYRHLFSYHSYQCYFKQFVLTHLSKQKWIVLIRMIIKLKVSKCAKISNRYNQVPHLTQNTNEKVTNSQRDTTNESQEVSPFPAGDRKAHINRRPQKHSIHKTAQKHKRPTKEVPPWNG